MCTCLTCVFVSYNGQRGCSKCKKFFKTERFGAKPDFSGYEQEEWEKRTLKNHQMISCQQHKQAKSRSAQQDIERAEGVRFSVLVELPSFDPIRCLIIDPMYNPYLGTAKYVTLFWIENQILSSDDLRVLQERVLKIVAPRSLGRLPLKVSTHFAGFTADQWRNWVVAYSAIALHSVLPPQHLQYWLVFVKACILGSQNVTIQNIHLAHKYLKMFCKKFQDVNGRLHAQYAFAPRFGRMLVWRRRPFA